MRKYNRTCQHDKDHNCVELPDETIPEEPADHEDCVECLLASLSG